MAAGAAAGRSCESAGERCSVEDKKRGEPSVWGKQLRLGVCEEAAGLPPVPGRPAAKGGPALVRGLWQRAESPSHGI